MGVGWSLSAGDAISRCPKNIFHHGEINAVQYDDSDVFCLNGQPLFMADGSTYGSDGSTYYTAIDNFAVITAHGQATDSGPQYFTVETKAGDTYYYGQTSDSFVEPNNPNKANGLAKLWALNKVVDVAGNAIVYHYEEDTEKGSHSLDYIEYGANENVSTSRHFNKIQFNYIENPKAIAGYSGGSTILMDKLLGSISITVDSEGYRYYDLGYFTSEIAEEKNYLDTITECISDSKTHCLDTLTFSWERPDAVEDEVVEKEYCFDDDGGLACERYEETVTQSYKPFTNENGPSLKSDGRLSARMLDINADGYSDIVYVDNGWWVQYGPYFASRAFLSHIGSDSGDYPYALTIDYNGDGKQELLVADSDSDNWHVLTYSPQAETEVDPGEFSASCDDGSIAVEFCDTYVAPKNFGEVDLGRTAIAFKDGARVMDVDGDGLQDIVFTVDSQIKMYQNLGGSFSAAKLLIDLTSVELTETLFAGLNVKFNPKMKNTAAIDINGDGRSDMLMKAKSSVASCSVGNMTDYASCVAAGGIWNTTNDTKWYLYVSGGTLAEPTLTVRDVIDYSDDDMRVADLNADGLTDIIYRKKDGDTWYYKLSNGYDFGAVQTSIFMSDGAEAGQTYFIDFNRDGRADVLKAISGKWQLWVSKASTIPEKVSWSKRGEMTRDKDDTVLFGDGNGDGRLDLFKAENDDGWYMQYGQPEGVIDQVITDFTNGWGVNTHVTYDSMLSDEVNISDADGNRLAGEPLADTLSPVSPMTVVKQVTSDSNHNDKVSVSYRYGGLLLHRKGLGSLGFKQLKTLDAQSGVETTTTYKQAYPYTGMPLSTVQKNSDGQLLSSAYNQVDQLTTAQGGVLPYVDMASQTQYQVGNDIANTHYQLATTVTDNDYDTWGNLTKSVVKVKDGDTLVHTTTTVNDYGTSWNEQKGRLLSTDVTKLLANGDSISRSF